MIDRIIEAQHELRADGYHITAVYLSEQTIEELKGGAVEASGDVEKRGGSLGTVGAIDVYEGTPERIETERGLTKEI